MATVSTYHGHPDDLDAEACRRANEETERVKTLPAYQAAQRTAHARDVWIPSWVERARERVIQAQKEDSFIESTMFRCPAWTFEAIKKELSDQGYNVMKEPFTNDHTVLISWASHLPKTPT